MTQGRERKGEIGKFLNEFEKVYYKFKFIINDGKVSQTAKSCGVDRQTLRKRLVDYGYIYEGGGNTRKFEKDYKEFLECEDNDWDFLERRTMKGNMKGFRFIFELYYKTK